MHSRSLLLALVSIGLFASARGQDAGLVGRVDRYVKAEMEKRQVPGLAVAVVKDGKVVLAKGYGVASLELPLAVTPETVFQTASIGKQFTATAVMMLVEQGKIGLDQRISTYLGEVPASWSEITVRQLLSHTSGVSGYPASLDFRRDYTEDELLKLIEGEPLAFKPGTDWLYSNPGYMTLGVIIRKVTGKPYYEFVRDQIFKPLGMTTARLISEPAIIPNRSAGYVLYDGKPVNQPWIAPTLNRTADGTSIS